MPIKLYSFDDHGQITEDEKKRIAHGIKRARKNAGYTQQQLADILNVNIKSVMNWDQGRSIPEWKDAFRLCNLFQCDIDYLFGRIDGRTHDLDYVQSETGLSEESILILRQQRETETPSILSRIISHRLFIALMRMIGKLSKPQVFTKLFADSVLNHLKNDGAYTDSPEDIKAIYANQASRTFDHIVDDIIKG